MAGMGLVRRGMQGLLRERPRPTEMARMAALSTATPLASDDATRAGWNSYHYTTGDSCPQLPSDKIVLLNMRFCPYAQRTVMVLEAKGLDYVNINCQLMNKPEWLWDFTPTGKVPVLMHEGRVLYESVVTCDYLDKVFPELPLNSTNPGDVAEERMLMELLAGRMVLPQMKVWFGFKRGDGPEERAKHWKQSLDGVDFVESRLAKMKTTFFSGLARPGMFDYFLWPWFERINMYSLVFGDEALRFPQTRFPHLSSWMSRMAEDVTVAPYVLSDETHAAFLHTLQSGNPDYNMLQNSST